MAKLTSFLQSFRQLNTKKFAKRKVSRKGVSTSLLKAAKKAHTGLSTNASRFLAKRKRPQLGVVRPRVPNRALLR